MTRLFEEQEPDAQMLALAKMAETVPPGEINTPAFIEAAKKAGLKFDAGKPRMELISPIAMEELGKVLAHGAKKYADRNWEKGLAWSRIIGSLLRHLFAYMRGERVDPESGCSHLAHVLCNAHFLVHYEKMRPEFDDLPKL